MTVSRRLRDLTSCFLLLLGGCQIVLGLLGATPSRAGSLACRPLEARVESLRQETQSLRLQLETLYQLEQMGVWPAEGFRTVIPVLLTSDEEIQTWWRTLQVALPEPAVSSAESVNCESLTGDLKSAWQARERYRQALTSIVARWSALPRSRKLVLIRTIENEDVAMRLKQEIQNSFGKDDALRGALQDWTNQYLDTLGQFFRLAARENVEGIRPVWRQALAMPTAETYLRHSLENFSAAPLTRPDHQQILISLNQLRTDLRLFSTRLRNSTFLPPTSRPVFDGLIDDPQSWIADILLEARMVPDVMLDKLTDEMLRDYRVGVKTDTLATILSGWVLQLFLLVLALWLLIMISRRLRVSLSEWQQLLLEKSESRVLNGTVSALFWFIKPNIDWLVMKIGSGQLMRLVPDQAFILQLLSPLGTMIALFYFAKVMREWWSSRIFGRSNQFLTGSQSDEILRSSRHFAKLVVFFYVAWLILLFAGGGRLYHLVILGFLITLWAGGVLYCRRHANIIKPFLLRLLPAQYAESGKAWLDNPFITLFYPLWMMLGQLIDLIWVLHQKLLNLDSYRRIATQILRLRLESAITEDPEEPEGEVSRAYSYWFLKQSPEQTGIIRLDSLTEELMAPINAWRNEKDPDNVLLISGHQGMGKTTALEIIAKNLDETPVIRMNVELKVTSRKAIFDTIAKHLNMTEFEAIKHLVEFDATQPKRVLLVDDCENMFLSDVGLLEGMRTFLECVNAKCPNLYWVIAIHRPAWDYLSKVFRREQRILTQYALPKWSASDIRKLILSRHHHSGFKLVYDELLLAAKATSDAANFRAAETRVFNLLWEQCSGNPEQAIYLWLNAAQKRKGRRVEIGMPAKPPQSALANLSDDSCFVYTAIVIHHRLNTEELVACTNLPEPIVRHALKIGMNLELLTYEEDRRYGINSFWYYTVITLLSRKNMLHG